MPTYNAHTSTMQIFFQKTATYDPTKKKCSDRQSRCSLVVLFFDCALIIGLPIWIETHLDNLRPYFLQLEAVALIRIEHRAKFGFAPLESPCDGILGLVEAIKHVRFADGYDFVGDPDDFGDGPANVRIGDRWD